MTDERTTNAALPVYVHRKTIHAALRLLDYVSDHGGGERSCEDEPCPSCDARQVARELRLALDVAEINRSQSWKGLTRPL